MTEAGEYFEGLSVSASKLAKVIGGVDITSDELADIAASYIHSYARDILLENLLNAIAKVKEYQENILAANLIRVFSDPLMISFSKNGVYIRAKELGGDWNDFQMGIDAAKKDLNLGKLSYLDALNFWKERIYGPAREDKVPHIFSHINWGKLKREHPRKKIRYNIRSRQETINLGGETYDYYAYAVEKYYGTVYARIVNWGKKAPYWLLLNSGSSGGYPSNAPTNFVEHSIIQINALFKDTIFALTEEYTNILNTEIVKFLEHPENYVPSQTISTFITAGGAYRASVTPKGRLGIRRVA